MSASLGRDLVREMKEGDRRFESNQRRRGEMKQRTVLGAYNPEEMISCYKNLI